MNALIVFFLLPTLIGVASMFFIRAMKGASLVAAIGAPLMVYVCIKVFDPDDAWNWLAAVLVSPLVMAIAVITVLLCLRRSRARKRDTWNDA